MTTKRWVIGVDLGGTNIKAALLNLTGQVQADLAVPTEADQGSGHVIGRIVDLAHQLMQQNQVSASEVLGVGIGLPGLADQQGTVVFAPNLKWSQVPLQRPIASALGLPVYLDNDANAAALGEKWCGAGQQAANLIVITIGTGIGSGIIIDGQLVRGAANSAGELGHTLMDPQGPRCNCGRQGCLETLTSATAMVNMARSAIERGRVTSLASLQSLQAKSIFTAAEAGDQVAQEIIAQVAYYLGWAIANLVNTLNPELVLLGGGVAQAGELLFQPIRQRVRECALDIPAQTVQILPAVLGNRAGSVGAGAIVLAAQGKLG